MFWAGWPFFVRAVQAVRCTAPPNMFTLIALGTGAAWIYSLVATLAPGFFPAASWSTASSTTYFEAAAVIVTLVLLGQVLELRARRKTGDAIRALLRLAPTTARRVDADGNETTCRSRTSTSATASACGPAKRCPWTARSPKAPAPSMSR